MRTLCRAYTTLPWSYEGSNIALRARVDKRLQSLLEYVMAIQIPAIIAARPASASIYSLLLPILAQFGEFRAEEKKTSLHLVAGRAAFLGVHPRKDGVRLNVVLARPLEGDRIVKSEKVSANVFHNEVDVCRPEDFDAELIGWLSEAYSRVSGSVVAS